MATQSEEILIRMGLDTSGMEVGLNRAKMTARAAGNDMTGSLGKTTTAMNDLKHASHGAMREVMVLGRELANGNWSRVKTSLSILLGQFNLLKYVFSAAGGVITAAAGAAYLIEQDLKKVNEQLDAAGELATHTFGDMRKSFQEATTEGARATVQMADKVNKLAAAQDNLKEKTDAAIKALHAQQALEQEAISAKSGASIARVNRLEEMGLITPEQAILSRSSIKSKAGADIEASKQAARQAELSKLTLAFLQADAAGTDLQKAMTGANADAFASPSAISRNAHLKDIPRQRTDIQKDLDERRKQLAEATKKLEGSSQYQLAERMREFLGTGGPRNAAQDQGARDVIADAERQIAPLRENQAVAQRFVILETKLLSSLDTQQTRLQTKQEALAAKYAEAVDAYTKNIAQVRDLSKTLDELQAAIGVQVRFTPGITASKTSQESNDVAAQLVKTNIGRALIGAQRIANDLYASKTVSPADMAGLVGIESAIAGRPVDPLTAARMAQVGALNPKAFQNQTSRLDAALQSFITAGPQGSPALAALVKNLEDLQMRGGSANNPIYTVITDN